MEASTRVFLAEMRAQLHNDRVDVIRGEAIASAIEKEQKMQKDFEDAQAKKKAEAAKYTKSSRLELPREVFKGVLEDINKKIAANAEASKATLGKAAMSKEEREEKIRELEAQKVYIDSKMEERRGSESAIKELAKAKAAIDEEIKTLSD